MARSIFVISATTGHALASNASSSPSRMRCEDVGRVVDVLAEQAGQELVLPPRAGGTEPGLALQQGGQVGSHSHLVLEVGGDDVQHLLVEELADRGQEVGRLRDELHDRKLTAGDGVDALGGPLVQRESDDSVRLNVSRRRSAGRGGPPAGAGAA